MQSNCTGRQSMRKYYKHLNTFQNMRGKKGQVAIFVIIALVIVGAILAVFLYPKISPQIGQEFTPQNYLRTCIGPSVKENMDLLMRQGGYANPEGYLEYLGEKIKYLCYTAEYYKTCIVQQPLIKEHVEKEMSDLLIGRARECVQGLKAEYEKRGYSVSLAQAGISFSINPGSLNLVFLSPMTITKESSQEFKQFVIDKPSQIYDLLLTTTSILAYESTYGDSETTLYMSYYPDLLMNKIKLADGSKVYQLTNVVTNETFQFASRSLSWPPGYGLGV